MIEKLELQSKSLLNKKNIISESNENKQQSSKNTTFYNEDKIVSIFKYRDNYEFNGDLGWEKKVTAREDHPNRLIFKNLQEAKAYTMKNPGHSFTRNPDGLGFIIKSTNKALQISNRKYHPKKLVFKNLQEAKVYAIKNPGHSFTRSSDGSGFIINNTNNTLCFSKKYDESLKRLDNIKQGKPARSTFRWRDQEFAYLLKIYNSGKEIHKIAIELERSFLAISSKLRNLELITEEEHQKNMKEVSSFSSNQEILRVRC